VTTKWIAVDFDGVVNSYSSGYGKGNLPDPPTPGAFAFLGLLLSSGYQVAIHSTRFKEQEQINQVRAWFRKHGLLETTLNALTFTAIKPNAELYVDDRAYRFEGKFPTLEEIVALSTPWHKRPKHAEVDLTQFLSVLEELLAGGTSHVDLHDKLLALLRTKA
jgi:hypothetical protein